MQNNRARPSNPAGPTRPFVLSFKAMRPQPMPHQSPSSGLTIIEILVASGLLAVVLVMMIVLFTQLLHNTEKNALLSAGAYFADSVVEQEVGKATALLEAANGDNSKNAFATTTMQGTGHLSTAGLDPTTEFTYTIIAKRLDPGTAGGYGQLWSLKVNVHWYGDAADGKVVREGFGNLHLEQTRLIYIPGAR